MPRLAVTSMDEAVRSAVHDVIVRAAGSIDTKKKIVAEFGENAAFAKGKPAPKPEK